MTVAAGKDLDTNATQTLGIIDTAYEIKVGVGYDWAPDVLKRGQIQINQQLATYLDVDPDNNDEIIVFLPNYFLNTQLAQVMAHPDLQDVMHVVAKKLDYSYKNGAFYDQYEEEIVKLGNLGAESFGDNLLLTYTLNATYAQNNGKFNKVLGNVAIIDCNYFFADVLDALTVLVNEDPRLTIVQKIALRTVIVGIRGEL